MDSIHTRTHTYIYNSYDYTLNTYILSAVYITMASLIDVIAQCFRFHYHFYYFLFIFGAYNDESIVQLICSEKY